MLIHKTKMFHDLTEECEIAIITWQWFDGDAVPKIADAARQCEVHYLNFEEFQKGNGYQIYILFITFLLCTKGSPF